MVLITALATLLYFTAQWGVTYFQIESLNEIVFHLKVSLKGANQDVLQNWIDSCLPISLTLIVAISALLIGLRPLFRLLRLRFMSWFAPTLAVIVSLVLLTLSISYASDTYDLPEYWHNQTNRSHIFEEHYVDPAKATLTFPAQPRNLIHIYVESLETTFSTSGLVEGTDVPGGGFQTTNYIPQLSKMAADNINFSNGDGLGGAYQAAGTGWTIAALVAQESGIPLTIPLEGNSYTGDVAFLPGAYSLGQVLQTQHYHQVMMVGSELAFGGRDLFFKQHGDYEVFDLLTARADGHVPPDYQVWWGFEDSKLISFAQEKLTALAADDQPFNFTMLTVNTHHAEGYPEADNHFITDPETSADSQFKNVIRMSDEQLAAFLSWIKEQDFYANTTVVLTGDHLSMNQSYLGEVAKDPFYERTTFNLFLNAAVVPVQPKNRQFTTMDIYPTVLAAMGVGIDGQRLGLGTNLFSDRQTLTEEMGLSTLNQQLALRSAFYDKRIIGG